MVGVETASRQTKCRTYKVFFIIPGKRFGKMQVLAGLMTFLKKYRVELADGMPPTTEFEPRNFVTQPKQGVKLKFIPREVSVN